jgi:hypothetical protein
MADKISAAAVEQFSKKLEAFASSLSDEERALFHGALDRGRLSESELDQVVGGSARFSTTAFAASAPRLNASFFNKLMCW